MAAAIQEEYYSMTFQKGELVTHEDIVEMVRRNAVIESAYFTIERSVAHDKPPLGPYPVIESVYTREACMVTFEVKNDEEWAIVRLISRRTNNTPRFTLDTLDEMY